MVSTFTLRFLLVISMFRRTFLIILAFLLIVLGLLAIPFPLPLGAPLLMAGFAILFSVSHMACRMAKNLRSQYPKMSERLSKLEDHRFAPVAIKNSLKRTNPSNG